MRMIPSAGYQYLASPYSHDDPYVRELRYMQAMREVDHFLSMGVPIYSPIVHCHELAKISKHRYDAEMWRRYNFVMLAAAENLWILMLPGWEDSKGIQGEMEEAKRVGIAAIQIQPRSPV